jgi:peptide-N4-(N-acetyl-beta-glucosaminyl)asparagine amidase
VLVQIVVEADGSVVDDITNLESISEGLRLVSIDDGDEADAAAAAAAARAQEKSDEELARMIQVSLVDIPCSS